MSKVIELLKDDANYYGELGRKYLSNSDIGTLLSNPKDFGKHREDNINFAKGRLFHQSILEPEKAKDFPHVDTHVRTTKVYKQYIEDNNVPFAMLTKEHEEIQGSVEIMIGNWDFFNMIRKIDASYEQPAVKEIHGQAYIYQTLFGKPMEFLVIDKKTGLLGHFKTSEEFLSRGEEKVKNAIDVYEKFYGDSKTEDIEDYYMKDVL